jgi:hypothetical protein
LLKLEFTHMNHVHRLAGVVLGCLFLLNGCGGGGGGGDSGPTPTTPTTPPTGTVLAGSLWSSDSNISDTQGTFASDLITGTSTKVNADTEAVPTADGSRLLRRDYTSDGSVGDATHITVVRATDGQLVTDLTVEGYVGTLWPSPQAANLVLTRWAPSINEPRSTVAYDIDQRKVLFSTPASARPDALAWTPDGGLLRVKQSGEITKLALGGAEQAVRTLAWPEGRVLQAVYVSPDGSKALVQLAALRESGSVSGVDLWMMNIDGSNLRRFTKNDLIANAFWSPDSKFVAFTKDTGVTCTDATCQGSCTVWYAEATASDVVAVAASGDAKQFSVKRTNNGSTTTLSCPVIAWTR